MTLPVEPDRDPGRIVDPPDRFPSVELYQRLAGAVSDILNADDDIEPGDVGGLLRWAWQTAPIGDCCSRCDGGGPIVWPHRRGSDGRYWYRCAAGHVWPCGWAPFMLNRVEV